MRSINRDPARAAATPDRIRDLIRGTRLDKGTYLDSLKGMVEGCKLGRNVAS